MSAYFNLMPVWGCSSVRKLGFDFHNHPKFLFDSSYIGKAGLQSVKARPLSLPLQRNYSCILEYVFAYLPEETDSLHPYLLYSYYTVTEAFSALVMVRSTIGK